MCSISMLFTDNRYLSFARKYFNYFFQNLHENVSIREEGGRGNGTLG